MPSRDVGIWTPPGRRPTAGVLALAAEAGALGGTGALARWQTGRPEAAAAYAHGERHDLWWEFDLAASFKWQAHVHRLNPVFFRERMQRLCERFDLAPLLERTVESLTPYERARANVAVALLPQPDLLLWEEPFRAIPGRDWMQLCRTVRRLCRTEGLTVLLVAACKEESHHERKHPHGTDHIGHRRHSWPGRRPAAAGGTTWS